MSRQLINVWRSISLLNFRPGSTLSIRSSPHVQLSVIVCPEWRDDGHLLLEQTFPPLDEKKHYSDTSQEAIMELSETKNEESGMKASVFVDLKHHFEKRSSSPSSSPSENNPQNVSQEKFHHPLRPDAIPEPPHGPPPRPSPSLTLTAKIPQRTNLSCHVSRNINLRGSKLEFDFADLTTTSGNISVKKLQGHDLTLRAPKGIIYGEKMIEGQNVLLDGARLRCKLMHVENVQINIHPSEQQIFQPMDVDDALALVDVSSLYTSQHGSANVTVSSSSSPHTPRNVRVKSNHGHISIQTDIGTTINQTDKYDHRIPVVELGGVNGSCDVNVESSDRRNDDDLPMAARIHVDSLSPGSVSVVTATQGDVEMTLDRKLDAELRFLSTPEMEDFDIENLIEEDNNESIPTVLINHDEKITSSSTDQSDQQISMKTNAFTESKHDQDFQNIQYVQGRVTNQSHEPDSRFDLKVKGKINVESAAEQALKGFSSSSEKMDVPLLVVGTNGNIDVETVSWFGSIARRYGIEEERKPELGRQAKKSRKGKGTNVEEQ